MSAEVVHTAVDYSVSESDRDIVIIVDAADKIVNLPSSRSVTKGHKVTVIQRAVSGGTGVQVNPQAADIIRGQTIAGVAITGAAGKNLINTGATDVLGDRVTLVADGLGKWDMIGLQGVWAIEP